ncbi:hypothetical protein F5Y04DRAFT_259533 [Hypomontagnella monticulosa]|nr:hypothetical protein F5Y04DRAFT_259533 [Hypomontagnella monticulosa]
MAPIPHKKLQTTPLAVELLQRADSINPQSASRFANLPRELRELIWRFALTRYEDIDNLYDLDKRFARPGQAGPLRVAVQLLATCRAIYVEAFLIPFQVNPLVIFDGDFRDIPPNNPLTRSPAEFGRCDRLKWWQFGNISSVELTLQQFNLEGGALERVARIAGTSGRNKGLEHRGYAAVGVAIFKPSENRDPINDTSSLIENPCISRKITHLSIRMSRTDWWGWESPPEYADRFPSEKLRLEPMINVTSLAAKPEHSLAMTRGYEARKAGKEPDFGLDDFEKPGRWGPMIEEHWPDLVTLDLVLETFACKRDQLDYVVECAKLWKFPLRDGFYLAWKGKEETVRWRGAESYAYEYSTAWFQEQNKARNAEGQGPATIRWRPFTPSDGDPEEAQLFVIRTLTFERMKDDDRFDLRDLHGASGSRA